MSFDASIYLSQVVLRCTDHIFPRYIPLWSE
jgi:hypothetical protein